MAELSNILEPEILLLSLILNEIRLVSVNYNIIRLSCLMLH